MDVKRSIDINCDLGEGMGNDAELMPFISTCSIACGGHFGTKDTIRQTIELAQEHRVKVGAHPSYPDKANFGRKRLNIDQADLAKSIFCQINDFLLVCDEQGSVPNHIKLHGALYNFATIDEETANTIATVIKDLNRTIPIFAPHNSVLANLIRDTHPVIYEAFIDRRYQQNGNLLSRSEPKAMIHQPNLAWEQLEQLYFHQKVSTSSNETIPLIAETYCLHGDAENALDIARFISERLHYQTITLDKDA